MINIEVDRKKLSIKLSGHADYAGKGADDIVCSASSMLIYTFCDYIMKNEQKYIHGKFIRYIEPGNTYIELEPNMDYYSEVSAMFDMIVNGYRLLEINYPENVRLNEKIYVYGLDNERKII